MSSLTASPFSKSPNTEQQVRYVDPTTSPIHFSRVSYFFRVDPEVSEMEIASQQRQSNEEAHLLSLHYKTISNMPKQDSEKCHTHGIEMFYGNQYLYPKGDVLNER
jgi:hypothetical protein